MNKKYLVINAGSSSLKFSLYEMPDEKEIISGCFEKIGKDDSFYTIKTDSKKIVKHSIISDHNKAVSTMINELFSSNSINNIDEIVGIGHRILHGGEIYSNSVVIDDSVLENIDSLTNLGPLHHPGEIAGVLAMKECIPDAINVAVFDTAFHQSIPKENYMQALPYEWYEKYGIRKYGFHGTSHKYILDSMKSILNKENPNLIICHIGSGASISEIKDGKSNNTTMGLTPLDGLIMGTRSGSIDPSILEYISKCSKKSIEEINDILNTKSGLLGICGKNDFRDVEKLATSGDEKAILAIKMFENSIIKYIAQYYFELNGNVDALCFTAGIGENSAKLRKSIISKIASPMNIKLNDEANENLSKYSEKNKGLITSKDSKVPVYVIPTNEELMILRDTFILSTEELNKKGTYLLQLQLK